MYSDFGGDVLCCNYHIQEVDIGLAADVGTLQRISKIVGNERYTYSKSIASCL